MAFRIGLAESYKRRVGILRRFLAAQPLPVAAQAPAVPVGTAALPAPRPMRVFRLERTGQA
jgi:hypothetical protein